MDLFDWASSRNAESMHEEAAEVLTSTAPTPSDIVDPGPSFVLPNTTPAHVDPVAAPMAPQLHSVRVLPTAAPDQLATFAEAFARLRADGTVPEPTLRRWESDASLAARAMGTTLERLPMAARELVPLIRKVRPGGRRLSHKTWSNRRSVLRRIACLFGMHAPKVKHPPPLSDTWQKLLAPVMPDVQRSPFVRFARWCDARGIMPENVDEAVLDQHQAWRADNMYTRDLVAVVAQIRNVWNGAVKRGVAGWPRHRLKTPGVEARRTVLSSSAFPESFGSDLNTYIDRLRGVGGPFKARARPLAPATIELYSGKVLAAATIRAGQLGGPEKITELACLVTPDAMEDILTARHASDGGRFTPSAMHLATSLVSVAREHVYRELKGEEKEKRLQTLRELQRQVGVKRQGRLTSAVRERLVPFDNERMRKNLFRLAGTICQQAEALLTERPVQAAAMHRRGILLHILLQSALRRRNLITLRLDTDFLRDPRGRITGLRLGGLRPTKNGVTVQADFSPEVTRALDRHLKVFRPLLPGAHGPWLVPHPSSDSHGSISGQTARLAADIRRRLGVDFNVHLTRHIVATILYEEDSGNSVVVQRMLGHSDVKVTNRLYGELTTVAAQRVWGEVIDRVASGRSRTSTTRKHKGKGRR